MADKLTPQRRSANMAAIRSKNTKPEIIVRSLAHRLGHRFRLHRRDLPGAPDLVFPRLRKVIFVHGCFWHQHSECREGRPPKSRPEYWGPKLSRNVARDEKHVSDLKALGWKVLTLWECEVADADRTKRRITKFLE